MKKIDILLIVSFCVLGLMIFINEAEPVESIEEAPVYEELEESVIAHPKKDEVWTIECKSTHRIDVFNQSYEIQFYTVEGESNTYGTYNAASQVISVRLGDKEDIYKTIEIAAHEATHFVHDMLVDRGLSLGTEDFAYPVGHVTEVIMRRYDDCDFYDTKNKD